MPRIVRTNGVDTSGTYAIAKRVLPNLRSIQRVNCELLNFTLVGLFNSHRGVQPRSRLL